MNTENALVVREQRVKEMALAIDPNGLLRAAGINVIEIADRAVENYERYRPASIDQMKRLEEITSKVYWIRNHAYDLRSKLIDKIGTFTYDGCGIAQEFDAFLDEIQAAREVEPE